uniref:Uncharacterized protein n=2 Tax=Amphimedon queenslandica TaxID=400682 RepID=A0A1X7TEJ7_AMPQE
TSISTSLTTPPTTSCVNVITPPTTSCVNVNTPTTASCVNITTPATTPPTTLSTTPPTTSCVNITTPPTTSCFTISTPGTSCVTSVVTSLPTTFDFHQQGTACQNLSRRFNEGTKYRIAGLFRVELILVQELGVSISENTIRGFKVAYLEELSRKRKADNEVPITVLPLKKRGRPLMLGERLDSMVQNYIRRTRDTGGIITTAVVIAGARGIVKAIDRTLLPKF